MKPTYKKQHKKICGEVQAAQDASKKRRMKSSQMSPEELRAWLTTIPSTPSPAFYDDPLEVGFESRYDAALSRGTRNKKTS